MKFPEFTNYIPKILKQQLPGVEAHVKMAPAERIQEMGTEYYKDKNPRISAVMMLFYPKNNKPHMVLIKRNTYPGIHSAQISLPGGKAEPEDNSLADTALRETFEEVGVEREKIRVVMPFSQIYIPPSNFLVSPFMGVSESQLTFVPNPAEVQQIIELPLEILLDDSVVVNVELQTSYSERMLVPAFKVEEHIIWGATAMILSELKETIKSALI